MAHRSHHSHSNTSTDDCPQATRPFHEKAGMSQVRFSLFLYALLFVLSVFSFLPVDSLHSS